MLDHNSNYFELMECVRKNPDEVGRAKELLDERNRRSSTRIKARLTPATVPSLLWDLSLREMRRMGPQIGEPVSDLAGHARFLRSLCASVPFKTTAPGADPQTDDLLHLCMELWSGMFYREMLDDLRLPDRRFEASHKFHLATMTSLLEAVQGDLVYAEQVEDRVRRQFGPFSTEIIIPSIGLSTEQVIRGFRQVRSIIAERWGLVADQGRPIAVRHQEFKEYATEKISKSDIEAFMNDESTRSALEKMKSAKQTLDNLFAFTPQDLEPELQEQAEAFLRAFSFIPGTINQALSSPYDEDGVRSRPFARIIGDPDQYLLLDFAYCTHSIPRRLLESFDTDRKRQRFMKKRDDDLESEAARLFAEVVRPDLLLENYHVPITSDGRMAERDLLLLKEDCLILVESKARPLRSVKGRRDRLTLIASDVQRTIQEGYNQACDVVRYIRSSGYPVPIFRTHDQAGEVLAEIDPSRIKTILTVVFLDSYYGLVASNLQPWMKLDESVGFPWAVDRDTFEAISWKVDSFAKLKEFLVWRCTLHGKASNEDETVFAGFYLIHGPSPLPNNADMVNLSPNYSDPIEAEYFRRQGIPVEAPPELRSPPVYSRMIRKGDTLELEIDGEMVDSVNLRTGETSTRKAKRVKRPKSSIRNSSCPCGSGQKAKKCCYRIRRS